MAAVDDLLRQLGADPAVETEPSGLGALAGQTGEAAADLPGAGRRLRTLASPIIGTATGIAAGALQNPMVKALSDVGASRYPGLAAQGPTAEGAVRLLKRDFSDDVGFSTGEFLGKYAPDFYGAAKLVGGAKALGEMAMEKAAPRIVARLNPARTGTLATQARELAAFAADKAGALIPASAPAVYRVGQGLSNVAGFGAFSGVRSAAEGNDPGTVASDALEGAGWGLLAETGFAALGAAVSKYAPRVNLAEAFEHYVVSKAPQAAQDLRKGLGAELKEATDTLAKKRIALEAERQVFVLAKDIEEQVGGRVARRGLSPIAEAAANVAKAEGGVKAATMKAQQSKHAFDAFNLEFVFGPVNPAALTRTKPLREGAFGMDARLALLHSKFPILAITPQAFAGKLGITGTRAYTALGQSESEFQTVWARKHDEALGFWKEARTIMGQPSAKNGHFFRPVGHAWEQGGAEQVLREFPEQGPQLVDLLNRIKSWRTELRAPAVKMGAEPNLNEEELAELGVKEHWAHVVRDLNQHESDSMMLSGLKKRLTRQNPTWTADRVTIEAQSLATKSNRYPNDKLSAVGSLDKTRYAPGTLSEKADDGMPFIEDYFESLVADSRAVVRRSSYAKRWGWDAELADRVVGLVAAEGGSESLMRAVLDGFFKVEPQRAGWRKAAQVLTDTQVASKMTFAVLPNMGQSSNTLGMMGIGTTMKGIVRAIRSENPQRLEHQVASLDGMFQALRATEFGGYTGHNWLQKLVDFEMKLMLFTPSEHINRMIGGAAATEMARDTLSKAVTGRLRGNNLEFARRQFAKLDANLDDMVARLKAGRALDPLEVDSLVYRGAQATQFMPDLTRRPFGWNTPLGRVLSQFNNFVIGQTNFLRHEIIAEAARGNYKPLATVALVYPTVGEFIGSALEVAGRERPQRGLGLWLDRLALSGGLGMVYQLYTAARWGRTAEMFVGPTAGDAFALGEAAYRSIASEDLEPLAKLARSRPAARGAVLFLDAGEWTLDNFAKFDAVLGSEPDATPGPTLDELRYRRAAEKSQR